MSLDELMDGVTKQVQNLFELFGFEGQCLAEIDTLTDPQQVTFTLSDFEPEMPLPLIWALLRNGFEYQDGKVSLTLRHEKEAE